MGVDKLLELDLDDNLYIRFSLGNTKYLNKLFLTTNTFTYFMVKKL